MLSISNLVYKLGTLQISLNEQIKQKLNDHGGDLASVVQFVENHPVYPRVAGLISGQGTCLACVLDPQ